jgi:hypothetical protein
MLTVYFLWQDLIFSPLYQDLKPFLSHELPVLFVRAQIQLSSLHFVFCKILDNYEDGPPFSHILNEVFFLQICKLNWSLDSFMCRPFLNVAMDPFVERSYFLMWQRSLPVKLLQDDLVCKDPPTLWKYTFHRTFHSSRLFSLKLCTWSWSWWTETFSEQRFSFTLAKDLQCKLLPEPHWPT